MSTNKQILQEAFAGTARGDGRAFVTKRGPAYPNRYCWIFRMAAGQVVEVTEYCDTALIERVLVRPPKEAHRPQ